MTDREREILNAHDEIKTEGKAREGGDGRGETEIDGDALKRAHKHGFESGFAEGDRKSSRQSWLRTGIFDPESASIFSRQFLSIALLVIWTAASWTSRDAMADTVWTATVTAIGYWFGRETQGSKS